jgi:diketogulonate reductase-like aldo/keto reductase
VYAWKVVLRWALDNNQIVIPRSSKMAHIKQNLDLQFTLPPADKAAIDGMDGTHTRAR